jgi:hypothetical protein
LGVPGAGGGTSLGIGDEPVPGVVVAVPGTVVVVPPGPVVPVGEVVVVLPVLFGVVVVVETPGPGPAAQFGLEIVSVSSVTAPLRASARPRIVTLLVTVMLCRARMVPTKCVRVPRVAELPICQNTLQEVAPLTRSTRLSLAVVNVEPAWKMKTEFGSPLPFSVSVPVSPTDDAELYTPGSSFFPPRSAAIAFLGPWPAAFM